MTSALLLPSEHRELATDAGVLRYRVVGVGPPLLMLHGSDPGVTGWRSFDGVLAPFAEFFRCLILEVPSHDAVSALIAGLRLESVDIVGDSTGGGIGIDYAISHPGRVRRLVTIGAAGSAPATMIQRVTASTLITWGRDDQMNSVDMAMRPMRMIPNAELHVFGHCGHSVMAEQPEAFVSTVLAFLLCKDSD
ncbi:MAG TPA: hypothetical protein VH496_15405 [Mycobacterium sp.]|jgi:pimeloyl-ACP methyl ester carboxylesterase